MRTLLVVPMVVIVLATGLLAGVLAGQAFIGYRDSVTAMQEVGRLDVLMSAQVQLMLERVATNAALAAENPMPESIARQLDTARRESSAHIDTAIRVTRRDTADRPDERGPDLGTDALATNLSGAREIVDDLLALARPDRHYDDIRAATDGMLGVARLFAVPVLDAIVQTTRADPGQAALLDIARLALSLREHAGRIANLFVSHITGHQPMDDGEIAQVRTLLGRMAELDRLLGEGLRIAASGTDAERLLEDVRGGYRDEIGPFLKGLIETGGRTGQYGITAGDFSSRYLVWSKAIVAIWEAVLKQASARVDINQAAALHRLRTAAAGIIIVGSAVLAAVVLLHRQVVVPVTRIGGTLVRIASGERTAPLPAIRGPREIRALAEAVEALRQTALVADATETRDRLAARQRANLLHQALATAQTVCEPARQIEQITARLAGNLELTRAGMATIGLLAENSLDAAANAVRDSVTALQRSSFMADAAVQALHEVSMDGRLGAAQELASRLATLDSFVDCWDGAVRNFSQPVLVALQRLEAAARHADHTAATPMRGILDGPFQDVQEVVATVARMRDAVARAGETLKTVAKQEIRAAA